MITRNKKARSPVGYIVSVYPFDVLCRIPLTRLIEISGNGAVLLCALKIVVHLCEQIFGPLLYEDRSLKHPRPDPNDLVGRLDYRVEVLIQLTLIY